MFGTPTKTLLLCRLSLKKDLYYFLCIYIYIYLTPKCNLKSEKKIMKKHMRVNWTRRHEKSTWNLSLSLFLYNWPSSKICKFFTPNLRVIHKKKHQKKAAKSSIPTIPLCLRAKKHQRSNARGHKGHRSTSMITALSSQIGGGMDGVGHEWPGRIWVFCRFLGVFWANSLGYSIDIQGHLVRFGIWTPRNMPKHRNSGGIWIPVVFYRDPMGNRDDVTGIPAYLDPTLRLGVTFCRFQVRFGVVFWV